MGSRVGRRDRETGAEEGRAGGWLGSADAALGPGREECSWVCTRSVSDGSWGDV